MRNATIKINKAMHILDCRFGAGDPGAAYIVTNDSGAIFAPRQGIHT